MGAVSDLFRSQRHRRNHRNSDGIRSRSERRLAAIHSILFDLRTAMGWSSGSGPRGEMVGGRRVIRPAFPAASRPASALGSTIPPDQSGVNCWLALTFSPCWEPEPAPNRGSPI